jgi:hypothetical protein
LPNKPIKRAPQEVCGPVIETLEAKNRKEQDMKKLCILVVMVSMLATHSMAAEQRSLKDVDIDAFTSDTQVTPKGAGDSHIAIVWWIPNEFWESILSRDTTTSTSNKKAMLDAMSGISLLAVVQADISTFGAFKFYSKEEIEKNIVLSFSDTGDKKQRLSTLQAIDPDLEVVLGVFKPILGAAMGNLGNNMHFYVLNDRSTSSLRVLDPYRKGQINIQLAKKDNGLMDASIELPINALFVPRKCPNGKDAHISWKYCPWTGQKLEE